LGNGLLRLAWGLWCFIVIIEQVGKRGSSGELWSLHLVNCKSLKDMERALKTVETYCGQRKSGLQTASKSETSEFTLNLKWFADATYNSVYSWCSINLKTFDWELTSIKASDD
jgi:hypothetical protein